MCLKLFSLFLSLSLSLACACPIRIVFFIFLEMPTFRPTQIGRMTTKRRKNQKSQNPHIHTKKDPKDFSLSTESCIRIYIYSWKNALKQGRLKIDSIIIVSLYLRIVKREESCSKRKNEIYVKKKVMFCYFKFEDLEVMYPKSFKRREFILSLSILLNEKKKRRRVDLRCAISYSKQDSLSFTSDIRREKMLSAVCILIA